MGHYTTLSLRVYVANKKECIDILQYMATKKYFDGHRIATPQHQFFQTDRWMTLLNKDSFAVSGTETILERDRFSEEYFLSVHTCIKNYCGEIEKFLDWLSPYAESGSHQHCVVGYIQQEESKTAQILQIYRGKIIRTNFVSTF